MILIVEDDEHKSSQIVQLIREELENSVELSIVDNVMEAARFLASKAPKKIILDMSLPSHKALPGQGTPVPLNTGGIEVLFEIKKRGLAELPVLILTQYPEIEIEDEPVPVADSAKTLKAAYGFSQLEACFYDRDNTAKWKEMTREFLRK